MVARLSCRHWSIGRWLLGKSACERKGWGQQSRGRDSVLTSGTCRNRYIYGWRLCTVTDFSMTIRTKEWVTSSVQQLCFTMKFHACRNTQSYILCILSHLKKKPWLFPKTGKQLHKKNPQTIQTALPSISCLKLVPAELQLKSFKLSINSCTITLWRLEYKISFQGAMLSPLDQHLFPPHLLQQVVQQAGYC